MKILAAPQEPAGRSSNLELLRIVSMAMIVLHHYAIYGSARYSEMHAGIGSFFFQLLFPLGKIGVSCFVLISGYFLVDSPFKIERLIRPAVGAWSYSLPVLLVLAAFGLCPVSGREALLALFPIVLRQYWFINAYLVMICLSPFTNLLIKSMDHRQHAWLLALLFLFFFIPPAHPSPGLDVSSVVWFFVLYLAAAYLKKYPHPLTTSRRFAAGLAAFSAVLTVALIALANAYFTWRGKVGNPAEFLNEITNPLVFLDGLSLFLFFLTHPMPTHRALNAIATTMLGVYLIHDHPAIKSVLWNRLCDGSAYQNTRLFVPHALLCAVGVMTACAAIEYGRRRLIEDPLMAWIQRHRAALAAFFRQSARRLFMAHT